MMSWGVLAVTVSPTVLSRYHTCWGCLVWVPSIYTSPGMYLVNHPVNLGTLVSN
ncbi:hypothetical protein MKW92_043563 [Papaver armeniacum]|nr:hypothetical protein MKW92_012704 [Papaver armeniacum]KAI3965289.1 hypothetical protein MKW92_043563 [Papaver armeniacum]